MATTLDEVLGEVRVASRKLDTLIEQMGIVMSLQDDIAGATAALRDETATLADSNAKLTQVLTDLRTAVAANQPVDPQVVADFEAALAQHKTSVDALAALAAPPAPDQPPAG